MKITSDSILDSVVRQKAWNLTFTAVSGIIILSIYSIVNFFLADYAVAIFEAVCALVLGISLYLFHKRGEKELAINLSSLVLLSMALHNFNTGGFSLSGLFWIFVIVAILFYIKGKEALGWIIFLHASLLFLTILSVTGIKKLPYDLTTIITFFTTLISTSVFTYIYNNTIDKSLLNLRNKSIELEDTLLDLSLEKAKTNSLFRSNQNKDKDPK